MDRQGRRLNLHEELCEVLGSRHVYFSPPETETMEYPCIVYFRTGDRNFKADNLSYLKYHTWDLRVIDYDPDSEIPERLEEHFEYINMGKEYTADNLNHFPFTLNY